MAQALESRRILLFVSSTFRDLMAERDELGKRVFPRVRAFCSERSVTFTEIDLRWGITPAQAEGRQILPRCFREIERCEPFFLGILGNRYGWVPEIGAHISEDFAETHPWLHEQTETSITELEFLYGALNLSKARANKWFYSRFPAHVAMPVEAGETTESLTKLERLKQRLRESDYPFREGYRDAPTLGQWVYQDLTSAIARLFPAAEPELRDSQQHGSRARQYRIGFSGRSKECRALSRLLKRKNGCVVVKGESGAGKAALLANWFCSLHETNAKRRASGGWIAGLQSCWKSNSTRRQINIIRFAGLNDTSSEPAMLALSVIREIRDKSGMQRGLPNDPPTALADLSSWLSQAGKIADVLLVIAGLARIEADPERARCWLPCPAPKGVKIVVSVTQGNNGFTERLEADGWHSLHIGVLTDDECRTAIETTLEHYGKHVADPERILNKLASRLPRFLRTFSEGLRLYGEFGEGGEKLDERMDWYLASSDESDLYSRVISGWQEDYECDRPGLVGDGLALLAVSHGGLEESEILDLLGADDKPLPRFLWTPLQASAENELSSSGGLIRITAGPFLSVVRELFIDGPEAERKLRRRLVEYHLSKPVSARHIDELLWQLAALGRWSELAAWLAEPENVHRFWDSHEFVLKQHCRELSKSAAITLASIYRDTDWDLVSPEAALTVSELFSDLGARSEVERLTSYLLRREQGLAAKQHRRLLSIRALLRMDDQPSEALALLNAEEALCEPTADGSALAACKGNQAVALRKLNRFEEALKAHADEERLCRERGEIRLLAGSLSNQVQLHIMRNQLAPAQQKLDELERLARTLQDPALVGRCSESRGICLNAQQKHHAAAHHLREAIARFREAADRQSLTFCLRRLAETEHAQGNLDGAMDCLDEATAIASECGDAALAAELAACRQELLDQFLK